MKGPILAALLVLTGAACTTPPPRVPFQYGDGWHVSILSGGRTMNSRYSNGFPVSGLEILTHPPGTSGWGWEGGLRFGDDRGADFERIRNPSAPPRTVLVPTVRDTDFYEFTVGARQTYFPDSPLQPYFGVGLSGTKTKNVDHNDLSGVTIPSGSNIHPRAVEHFETVALGLYVRTGLSWNVLRDQIRDETEFVIGLDVRGLLGDEFSFVEVALSLGYGR